MTESPVLLVTGATGFIGRHALASLPISVDIHGVRRGSGAAPDPHVTWHQADLRVPSECEALIAQVRPTHLIHLAWSTEHGRFWTDPDNRRWLEAGVALVRAFGQSGGARAVIAGTCAEYPAGVASPIPENQAERDPGTPYGAAKDALRRRAESLASEYGFAVAWPRIFLPFGDGEAPARFIPSLIISLLKGLPVATTRGNKTRDFMDVRDVGAALARLTFATLTGPVNLGSGESRTIADMATLIGTLMQRSELISVGALPERSGDPQMLVPKLDRMRRDLGFTPSISIEAGVRDAIAWWSQRIH